MTDESTTDSATGAVASPESLAPSDRNKLVGIGPGVSTYLAPRAERRNADTGGARSADKGGSSEDRFSDLSMLVVRRGSA